MTTCLLEPEVKEEQELEFGIDVAEGESMSVAFDYEVMDEVDENKLAGTNSDMVDAIAGSVKEVLEAIEPNKFEEEYLVGVEQVRKQIAKQLALPPDLLGQRVPYNEIPKGTVEVTKHANDSDVPGFGAIPARILNEKKAGNRRFIESAKSPVSMSAFSFIPSFACCCPSRARPF